MVSPELHLTMSGTAIDEYVAGIDGRLAPIVAALDDAIVGAGAELACAVKYRMLTYAIGGDFQHWVCAIDAHPRSGVAVRFLYGDLLDFSGISHRAGSTTMRTIDHRELDDVDASLIAGLVAEATTRYADFKVRELAAPAARRS